ncbi:MAG: GAF domain-containing protein [Deltaproteobacteria bacterium]|nr:GAF domain-containing protein [Deltaproteobacteria bacterium]MBW2053296.1 GAF domain-containing protein [Deltaproteobacteria bacterium]MBW2141958.1 GAF domain-containing protein [Deltaproteobacteria bacterium]MBW2323493.1 GAF domain-containing protein [Deltaproteobacteria bacterium]
MSPRSNSVSVLDKVIRISNSTVDIERRLNNLLDLLKREFKTDKAGLFTLDRDGMALVLRNMDSSDPKKPETLRFELKDSFIGRTAFMRKPILLGPDQRGKQDWPLQAFFQKYNTLATFPIMDDQHLYGVLALLNIEPREYTPRQLSLLDSISREMAGTIRNSRLYVEAKKRIAELSVLYEVGKAVSSTIDLDKILDKVVTISANVLMAEGCALNVLDESTGVLRVAAVFGNIPAACRFKHLLDKKDKSIEEVMRLCVSRGEAYFGPASKDIFCKYIKKEGEDKSILCLPLSFKGPYKGTLSLYNKTAAASGQRQEFNREDLELMTTMGAMISSSLENALTFQTVDALGQHNEDLVRSLSSLYEISSAMMTTVKMDELLNVIINALTHRQGLGFERALLFLVDEEEKYLTGASMSNVTVEERAEKAEDLAVALSHQPVLTSEQAGRLQDFRNLKLPLNKDGGVLVQTVLNKKPAIVSDVDPDWDSARMFDFGRQPFASIPMLAKGKVVGVCVVDRAFSQDPITTEDIRNLSMLANQTGLAIENSQLYEYIENVNKELTQARERLIEAEKLAALGEMAAGMAHEIRNPLVSIGGFTRRILKVIDKDSPIIPYIKVIIDEVTRLEKTLHDVLDFARDTQGHYSWYALNEVADEALYLLKRDLIEAQIEVIKDFHYNLPNVYVDERQIKHVFFNLFLNAYQAMEKGGKLTVRTFLTQINEMPAVACEVADTGPGIPPEVLPNIFNPFFTTKDTGAGLGLSIVHKILSRHHGEIDVFNRKEEGASFIVKLPSIEYAGIYMG